MLVTRFLALLICAQWTAVAFAVAPIQDMQLLRQLGNDWLNQQAAQVWPDVRARARTGPVDERLRLAACRDIRFSLVAGARLGHGGSVKAQCLAPIRWSLYLGYRIVLFGPALVARRELPARAIIGGNDLETREIEYLQSPGAYPNDLRLVLGARTDRRIPAGEPILAESLSRPPAITAGQRVQVVVRGSGFNVSQEGSALNTAAMGEPVRVRTRSGRIVQGIAGDDGSVHVQP